MMCQFHHLLSEHSAHKLLWKKFIKNFGGLGVTIPLDLGLEHLHRLLKNVLRILGPNATNHNAIDQYCKALVTAKKLTGATRLLLAFVIQESMLHMKQQMT